MYRAISPQVQLASISGGTDIVSCFCLGVPWLPVRRGEIHTGWLDRLAADGSHAPTRHGDVALVAAALDAADEVHAIDRQRFFGWASRGRPQLDRGHGHEIQLRHGSATYRLLVRQVGQQTFVIRTADRLLLVERARLGRARSAVTIAAQRFPVVSSIDGTTHLVEVNGDTATGEVLCTARHLSVDPDDNDAVVVVIRYVDEYERLDGRWCISDRQIRFLWSERHVVADPGF